MKPALKRKREEGEQAGDERRASGSGAKAGGASKRGDEAPKKKQRVEDGKETGINRESGSERVAALSQTVRHRVPPELVQPPDGMKSKGLFCLLSRLGS